MFILDELYRTDEMYPHKGSCVEKFLYYREQKDDIDADVCYQNVKQYCKKNPLISKDATIEKQHSNNKSSSKYQINDNGMVYRGETLINCMQVLLQIVNYENELERITSDDIDKIRDGLKNSSILNENLMLKEKLEDFVKHCYSGGNFFAIPYISGFSLNQAKVKLKQRGNRYTFVDSSDTYFKVCYNYFVEGVNGCQLTRFIEEKYLNWKKRYYGKEGWLLFINDNCFSSFMVNNKPIKMWNNTKDGFVKDLERYLDIAINALSDREKMLSID